jgi:hypothetical protein
VNARLIADRTRIPYGLESAWIVDKTVPGSAFGFGCVRGDNLERLQALLLTITPLSSKHDSTDYQPGEEREH